MTFDEFFNALYKIKGAMNICTVHVPLDYSPDIWAKERNIGQYDYHQVYFFMKDDKLYTRKEEAQVEITLRQMFALHNIIGSYNVFLNAVPTSDMWREKIPEEICKMIEANFYATQNDFYSHLKSCFGRNFLIEYEELKCI